MAGSAHRTGPAQRPAGRRGGLGGTGHAAGIGRARAVPVVAGTETGAFQRIESLERELVALRAAVGEDLRVPAGSGARATGPASGAGRASGAGLPSGAGPVSGAGVVSGGGPGVGLPARASGSGAPSDTRVAADDPWGGPARTRVAPDPAGDVASLRPSSGPPHGSPSSAPSSPASGPAGWSTPPGSAGVWAAQAEGAPVPPQIRGGPRYGRRSGSTRPTRSSSRPRSGRRGANAPARSPAYSSAAGS